MFESTDAESVAGRGRNFWLLTVVGLLTSGSIVRHAIQGFRLLTEPGFLYLGLSLVAIVVGWLHYAKLQSGFSKIGEQVDEPVLDRFQNSAAWLYIMVNVAIFALMHFLPRLGPSLR